VTAALPLTLPAEEGAPAAAVSPDSSDTISRGDWARDRGAAFGRGLLSALIGLLVIMALWLGFIHLLGLNPLVAKSPWQVAKYLEEGGLPGETESQLWHELVRTLKDAGIGYVVGMAAAMAVALTLAVIPALQGMFMPIAVTIRSVPLVAMTPLLVLIFGRGIAGTAVISGIVVFFPALVTIAFGLQSTPRQTIDLVRAYGGGQPAVVTKVMIPWSLPAVFAAARVAVPGAIVGALLAEWLATGKGLGYLMLTDTAQFNYDQLWASVFVLTMCSVILYYTVGAVESIVLSRFGAPAAKR
jgi:ABC-type nitrate/sulfonate/bicarbonate transport system permease component